MHKIFKNCQIDYEKYIEIRKYAKNALIENEGNTCQKLGLVLEGEVIISTLAYSDKEYIIKYLHKNEHFGEVLLFSDNNKFLGDIISNGCKIGYIHKNDLFHLFKDKVFLNNYLKIISNEMADSQLRIKLLSQKNIKDRILFYLNLNYKKTNLKKLKINSKESLALLLNIPRPSLSRELIHLKNEGIIDFDRNSITIL